ncbi:hypothetical protein JXA34_02625 [Patescibacteria group bacterium]|nr:hypothetical protein [Patescibacteria group bacterium]
MFNTKKLGTRLKLNKETKYLALLLLFMGALRFVNLGYSEYIPDETYLLMPLKISGNFYGWDRFLSERKGPIQFLVTYLVYLVNGSVFPELTFRVPYALFNSFSILFFYLAVKNITKSDKVAFLSSFIFGVNGFTVAFGRIVQYQSLNLFFSTVCMYFYSDILKGDSGNFVRNVALGNVFYLLSLLSHWDAVFIMPFLFICCVTQLRGTYNKRSYKILAFLLPVVMSILIVSVYFAQYSKNADTMDYFRSRVGLSLNVVEKIYEYDFRYTLYNPFLFRLVMVSAIVLSMVSFKKHKYYLLWLVAVLLFFVIFIKSSGTHVYNFLYPISILVGSSFVEIQNRLRGTCKYIGYVSGAVICCFLYYQTYMIIVDNRLEYPFVSEKILFLETKQYNHKSLTNNIIGFPLRRNWMEINSYINDQNKKLGRDLTYITNEHRSIADMYMDIEKKESKAGYFIIGIKNPLSFVQDYKFSQIRGKEHLTTVRDRGKTLGRIYLVE